MEAGHFRSEAEKKGQNTGRVKEEDQKKGKQLAHTIQDRLKTLKLIMLIQKCGKTSKTGSVTQKHHT